MGKNISVYLDDNLSSMLTASGMPPSQIIQLALKKFFLSDKREHAFNVVANTAQELGAKPNFSAVVQDWQTEREAERW